MKTLILLVAVLSATVAYAGSDCRVLEFPDHYEAICNGSAPQGSSADLRPVQEQTVVHEQPVVTVLAAQEEVSSDGDLRIQRSELGRRHAEIWLASQPRM
jgi:hypothetical protein